MRSFHCEKLPLASTASHPSACCFLPTGTLGGLRLRAGDDLWVEAASAEDAPSLLVQQRERARHRMEISFNALEDASFYGGGVSFDAAAAAAADVDADASPFDSSASPALEHLCVKVDGRQTLAELKAAIAARLGEPAATLRLRRAAKGAHLKNEESTPLGSGTGGAGLTNGSSVRPTRHHDALPLHRPSPLSAPRRIEHLPCADHVRRIERLAPCHVLTTRAVSSTYRRCTWSEGRPWPKRMCS